jgi:hypothetical protein
MIRSDLLREHQQQPLLYVALFLLFRDPDNYF